MSKARMTRMQKPAAFAIAYHRHKDNEQGLPEEFGFCGPKGAPTKFLTRDVAQAHMEQHFEKREGVCYSVVHFDF